MHKLGQQQEMKNKQFTKARCCLEGGVDVEVIPRVLSPSITFIPFKKKISHNSGLCWNWANKKQGEFFP